MSTCLDKANAGMPHFVLLEKDPAAGWTIRMWALQRCKLGLNQCTDDKIKDAYRIADEFDAIHGKVVERVEETSDLA